MIPRLPLRAFLFLACALLCSAFSNNAVKSSAKVPTRLSVKSTREVLDNAEDIMARGWKRAASISAAVVVATTVLQPVQPSLAVQPTLNEAIVEVSETSYPILRALDPAGFRDFSTKIGDILLKISPDKLGKSIDLGIDYLDSVSPDKLANFNSLLKDTYADVSLDSCATAPLPPMAVVNKFGAIATEKVDAAKLKTFEETWKPSLDALKKDDDKICLPANRAALDKLALAQADLGRSFGKAETKAFGAYFGPLAKQVFTPGKALDLVADAKKLTPNASPQAKKEFAAAGKKAEAASQLEIARNKIAEKKAKQAANLAK